MYAKIRKLALVFMLLMALTLTACGGDAADGGDDDLLAQIQERGTLVIATDPAYPPQSVLAEGETRAADTKCTEDQHTANEFSGFDIDTAVEIADRLGVEACFVTPDWEVLTAGNWADRWDISVGSMTVTPGRMENLYFSQPYYATPASFFVHVDNAFAAPADLSGANVGMCSGCTYEEYMLGTLSIPGIDIDYVAGDAEIQTYETDSFALEDLALGDGVRLDAVLTALPTGTAYIADGGAVKPLGEPVFYEYLAAAIDKHSSKDGASFTIKVSEIIQEMHADGTLAELAGNYYDYDATSGAGDYDVANLDQFGE